MNQSDESYSFFIQNFGRIACSLDASRTTAIYLLKNHLSRPPCLASQPNTECKLTEAVKAEIKVRD